MCGRSIAKRAFTIVELLVVIAIIGVLMGMLFPAVMAAREAGNRAQCESNIKQLGFAMQHYESRSGYFPNNRGWGLEEKDGLNTTGYSWITMILPYIEADAIYSRIKMDKPLNYDETTPPPSGIRNNLTAAKQKISLLQCPSDINTGTTNNCLIFPTIPSDTALGSTNYKACAGANWLHSVDTSTLAFKINEATPNQQGRKRPHPQLPAVENDGRENGNGIICRNWLPTTTDKPLMTAIADIRDGTSHTFAVGEATVNACNYNGWYWFNGTTATCAMPLNYKNPSVTTQNPNDWMYTYGFRSRHPGGGNFCMCDGRVKFVNDNIDLAVYQAQATIMGGELIDDSDY